MIITFNESMGSPPLFKLQNEVGSVIPSYSAEFLDLEQKIINVTIYVQEYNQEGTYHFSEFTSYKNISNYGIVGHKFDSEELSRLNFTFTFVTKVDRVLPQIIPSNFFCSFLKLISIFSK
jgi:hypothetical protein